MPRKKRKDAEIRSTNLTSLNGSKNTLNWRARGLGGRREDTVNNAMIIRPRIRKAMAAQVNQ
jgi:hypothetical protein